MENKFPDSGYELNSHNELSNNIILVSFTTDEIDFNKLGPETFKLIFFLNHLTNNNNLVYYLPNVEYKKNNKLFDENIKNKHMIFFEKTAKRLPFANLKKRVYNLNTKFNFKKIYLNNVPLVKSLANTTFFSKIELINTNFGYINNLLKIPKLERDSENNNHIYFGPIDKTIFNVILNNNVMHPLTVLYTHISLSNEDKVIFRDLIKKGVPNIKIIKYVNWEKSVSVLNNSKYFLKFEESDTVFNSFLKLNNIIEESVPTVSIVLLCYNNWTYTDRCIESIYKNTNYINYELIIVNNNSSDETHIKLSKLKKKHNNITYVKNNINRNFSGGMNDGVKVARGKYVILLNNDTYCFPNWLTPLINTMEQNANIGILTPITNRSGNESRIFIKHSNPNNYFNKIQNIIKSDKDHDYCDRAGLFCGIVRKTQFDKIGGFDENYKNGWEDDDISEQYKERGFKIAFCYKSAVYHFGSVTVGTNAYGPNNPNRKYFEKKWCKEWESAWIANDTRFKIKNDKIEFTQIIVPTVHVPKQNIYVLCKRVGGGGTKYTDDLTNKFGKINNFYFIEGNDQLKAITFTKNDIILFMNVLFTDIDLQLLINKISESHAQLFFTLHDFMWINSEIQRDWKHNCHWRYLQTNININRTINNLFELSTCIVAPSFFVKKEYLKFFPKLSNFNVVYHNDIKINTNNITNTKITNNKINIGIMHSYSEYKGCELVNILKNSLTSYENNDLNYLIIDKNMPPYDENKFMDHIKKYNIHCLLILNKWGETWCYTLTKYINSGLPFLYNNIGAFKERLVQDNRRIICFDSESQILSCIKNENKSSRELLFSRFKKLIDIVIENNGKASCYTHNSNITYNPYYECLLSKYKNVVLITSKIYVSNNPFSYSKTRSIYTIEERFNDTLKTIKSVKKYIPNSYIILIDNSKMTSEQVNILENNVSKFLNPWDNLELDKFTNNSSIKALGELSQTKYALEYLKKENITVNNFFKISGRYIINDNFDLSLFINDKNIFSKNLNVRDRDYFYTCFYKINFKTYTNYITIIDNCIRFYLDNSKGHDLEVILPKILKYNFKLVDKLGITQNIAVWKDLSDI